MKRRTRSDQVYTLVANEENARICTDISDAACRVVPGNFFRIMFASVLSKIGDLLINPKTVLAWLIVALGAPPALVGLLVPIRESGSMIPQLLIGAWVRHFPVRKRFWVAGALLQGLAVFGMAVVVWLLQGLAAGLAVIALLTMFSLSRGLCSVSMKDVQGKCIPRPRRGRLAGLASTISGLVTLLGGVLLIVGDSDPGKRLYGIVLLVAATTWWLAAAVFARVREYAGETAGGGHALREGWRNLRLLKNDPPFRHFVMARALLLGSALGSPFVVVLARQQSGGIALLAGFVLTSSLASAVSASIWGFMADVSSRRVMIRGGGLAALMCLLVAGYAMIGPRWSGNVWFYPAAFFVLAIAHSGVRIGRKTYLLNMAEGNKRTDYTAVSNTVIGLVLLATGGISAAVALLGASWALVLLGAMGMAGTLMSWRLPEPN